MISLFNLQMEGWGCGLTVGKLCRFSLQSWGECKRSKRRFGDFKDMKEDGEEGSCASHCILMEGRGQELTFCVLRRSDIGQLVKGEQ